MTSNKSSPSDVKSENRILFNSPLLYLWTVELRYLGKREPNSGAKLFYSIGLSH
jgi:hypothetical protein